MAAGVPNPRAQTTSLSSNPAQRQPEEEQFLSTFFCRALFDYQTDNDSSLSFHRDDIIQVLTRSGSGWWDGLLGQERGWFPSNYVTVISDQEAVAAAATRLEFQNAQATIDHTHNFGFAHPQNVVTFQEWDQPHDTLQPHAHTPSHSQNIQPHANNTTYPQQNSTAASIGLRDDGLYPRSETQSSDFWVPQVSTDGRVSTNLSCSNSIFSALAPLEHPFAFTTYPHPIRDIPCYGRLLSSFLASFVQIYYVNTQTGQQSRDPLQDVDQGISEGELPPPTNFCTVYLTMHTKQVHSFLVNTQDQMHLPWMLI